ncbi:hypothetical protein ACP70R_035031 [Stipagrostis hirtigluma subsp. patula]
MDNGASRGGSGDSAEISRLRGGEAGGAAPAVGKGEERLCTGRTPAAPIHAACAPGARDGSLPPRCLCAASAPATRLLAACAPPVRRLGAGRPPPCRMCTASTPPSRQEPATPTETTTRSKGIEEEGERGNARDAPSCG